MSVAARRRRRRLVAPLLLIAAAALLVAGHASRGSGDETAGAPVVQPWLGVIDQGGTLIDASPDEAKGEVWSLGEGRVLKFTDAGGWVATPAPLDADGQPIEHLSGPGGTLSGRATRDGAVALLSNDALLVRDPGADRLHAAAAPAVADAGASTTAPPTTAAPGSTSAPATTNAPATTGAPASTSAPASTAAPGTTATAPLKAGEKLYGDGPPLVAALSEDGRAGAFVVPTAGADETRDAVLHFDGTTWTREPICLDDDCDPPPDGFAVEGLDAAGLGHAWLLAGGRTLSAAGDPEDAGVVLLHRVVAGGQPSWTPVSLGGSPFADRQADLGGGDTATVAPREQGQPLAVTARGAWADVTVKDHAGASHDATLFLTEGSGAVTAWCDLGAPLCDKPLGADLSSGSGRSFAWDDGSPYGVRLITSLAQGAMLRLDGDAFARVPTAGRSAGYRGAAFAAPDDGWLGGTLNVIRYSRAPEPDRLRPWPVPFRHPLTAIAAEPGKAVGAIDAQAIAVGDQGEVARYAPGQGWSPEPLLGVTGKRAIPRLRGVAWPAADRAYAVGDKAEMWLWRKATGLWEPDPAKPPNLGTANFTGIAFDPSDPDRGYAIGKQGVLLRYDRQWTQEPLPDGLGQANFTSVAFAGRQAIVTYDTAVRTPEFEGYRGGILINDGSGWRKDDGLAAALPTPTTTGELPGAESTPARVAGLPDGSAVVATMSGVVVERDGTGGAWRAAGADPVGGYPAALAAFHEDGQVRAIVSVDLGDTAAASLKIDVDALVNPAPPGQAPVLLDPYPLSTTGYVLRQTAHGWEDEQHAAWVDLAPVTSAYDLPERPDPVLALLTDPFGRSGWAVGGDSTVQTATVMRYPDDGQSAPGAATAPVATNPDMATFAVGGGAGCLSACADLEPVGAAPWRWLPAAVARAAQIPDVRAFLDTGPGIAGPAATADDFAHEEAAAAERLTASAGALPVYTAAADSDRGPGGSVATFLNAFQAASMPLGGRPTARLGGYSARPSDQAYYAFDSADGAKAVRVVVLDTSSGSLGEDQRCWLAQQLWGAAQGATPAIVVGNRDVGDLGDGDAVAATLVTGAAPTTTSCPLPDAPGVSAASASAYFYNAPEVNRRGTVVSGHDAIKAFGTGSLGYITPPLTFETDKPPNSGFLLAEVNLATRDPQSNRAEVDARLIPNIAELAVDATDGTLLRRSQVALFDGLARRPRSGQGCVNGPTNCQIVPDPYTPVPDDCVGAGCDTVITPDFHFASSDPSIAGFVAHDPASTNPRSLLLDAAGDPVASSTSGLLCAYNPGTTTITLTTGGLSYSQKVTVQAGSVQRPCGTVPASATAAQRPADATDRIAADTPPPAVQPTPAGGAGPLPPPAAPAPAKVVAKPAAKTPKALPPAPAFAPFVPVASGLTQVVGVPPPPPPTAARPAPPSGTSSANVYQSAVAPERQREEEHQLEMQSNAVRYEAGRPLPAIASRGGALVLLVLAGLAFTDLRPRPRRRPAFNTITNDRRDPRTPR